ncbi:hypothetical protein [Chryseobacterium sp. 2R14A]|uniref:hypothetical protein n=1 Tax=Chryseobacterium sp. 2R14A TaxID=3380353 RepID=UPI003CF7944B
MQSKAIRQYLRPNPRSSNSTLHHGCVSLILSWYTNDPGLSRYCSLKYTGSFYLVHQPKIEPRNTEFIQDYVIQYPNV